MAIDAQRIVDTLPYINVVWSAFLQIALALYFLYSLVGVRFCLSVIDKIVTLLLLQFFGRNGTNPHCSPTQFVESKAW